MKDLSPAELKQELLADRSIILLDVREPWEFEIAHIEDSKLIPMGELNQRLSELTPNSAVAVICHHGIRSRIACLLLEQNDFQNVFNLRGGIDAWAKEVDHNMPLYT